MWEAKWGTLEKKMVLASSSMLVKLGIKGDVKGVL
jgi:hypothetical protein